MMQQPQPLIVCKLRFGAAVHPATAKRICCTCISGLKTSCIQNKYCITGYFPTPPHTGHHYFLQPLRRYCGVLNASMYACSIHTCTLLDDAMRCHAMRWYHVTFLLCFEFTNDKVGDTDVGTDWLIVCPGVRRRIENLVSREDDAAT
jgi:hypothetical protein